MAFSFADIVAKKGASKIGRDAFLYMEGPDEPKFAQCETCWVFAAKAERCAILGPDLEVLPQDTCGAYLRGSFKSGTKIQALATPAEVGFLKKTSVRCENCKYGGSKCKLYVMLNETLPDIFDLDTSIKARGCCNAWKQ